MLTAGPLKIAEDVADALVRGQESGWTIRVRDVAQVRDTFEKERQRVRVNGQPAIVLLPKKKRSADALELIKAIVSVSFTNNNRAAGMSIEEACLEAGYTRLCPICASSITTLAI